MHQVERILRGPMPLDVPEPQEILMQTSPLKRVKRKSFGWNASGGESTLSRAPIKKDTRREVRHCQSSRFFAGVCVEHYQSPPFCWMNDCSMAICDCLVVAVDCVLFFSVSLSRSATCPCASCPKTVYVKTFSEGLLGCRVLWGSFLLRNMPHSIHQWPSS